MALLAALRHLGNGVGPAPGRPARERYEYERGWPDDVWSIGVDRIDLLGVSERGDLHWNGVPIEIRKPLVLTLWQRIAASAVAFAAIVAAVGSGVSAWSAWNSDTSRDSTANRARCLAVQRDMLSARPHRTDGPDLFQALGCRPQGEGSVYAAARRPIR